MPDRSLRTQFRPKSKHSPPAHEEEEDHLSTTTFVRAAAILSLLVTSALALTLASCKDGRPRAESSNGHAAPDAAPKPPPPPTYWNRVAGILEEHCVACHAEGGIAPMSLVSFADAKTHAGAIAFQTRARHMPPWLPDTSECAEISHSRALPDADIDALQKWAELGAPEGRPEDKRAPVVVGSSVKKNALAPVADRVAVPVDGYSPKRAKADDYHCFVLDPKLDRPERIVGLRVAPGLPAVVHHVLLFEVRASAIDRIKELDAQEPGPGYTCFGGIGVSPTVRPGNLAKGELVDFDAQMIVGWAPGASASAGTNAGAPTPLPGGTAIKLAPGSRLVMQVHYSLENYLAGTTDKTKVEMWFAKDNDALRQAVWVPLLKYDFKVPVNAGPDDARASARGEIPLPFPLEIRGVAGHMHLRGHSLKVDALTDNDDGAPPVDAGKESSSCLLDIPRWDFRHQEGYWLEKGQRVSKASITCKWDNRTSNQPVVNGKRKAPHPLKWGEGTDDEMCLAFLYATL